MVTGVPLSAATGNAQHPFMGQCAWTLGTLSLPSLDHSCLFSTVSSLPPHPPNFLWLSQTQHCMIFQLRFLKISRERKLIACQLAKGRVDRELRGPWCKRSRPAMSFPECSSSVPALRHLLTSVESQPCQDRPAGNSGFGRLQGQPPQAAPETLEIAILLSRGQGYLTWAGNLSLSPQDPETQAGVEGKDQSESFRGSGRGSPFPGWGRLVGQRKQPLTLAPRLCPLLPGPGPSTPLTMSRSLQEPSSLWSS